MTRLVLTREYLIELYINQNKTLFNISQESGWHIQTICGYLKKFNIKKQGVIEIPRKKGSKLLTKRLLYEEYIINKLSTTKIANKYELSPTTIQRKLEKYQIPIKNNADYHEDIIGKQFGNLKVLKKSIAKHKNPHSYYICLCVCGTEKEVRGDRLSTGANTSCGCRMNKDGAENGKWSGYEGISGTYWNRLELRAKYKNLDFNIKIEKMWELFLKQDKKCSISGILLTPPNKEGYGKSNINIASLDRIDSSKGYIEGNVQWVSRPINVMKMALPQNEFINICKIIARNNS